jgi:hypothetical protein
MQKKLNFSIYVEDDYTEDEIQEVVNDLYRSVEYAERGAGMIGYDGWEEVED